mmetsp:Transcript_35150/g.111758  ORF Transcript_35150/g.111758 Transcript_35150/m.111758 type:complete len:96 (+) Transcript_35150:751-1038(+)
MAVVPPGAVELLEARDALEERYLEKRGGFDAYAACLFDLAYLLLREYGAGTSPRDEELVGEIFNVLERLEDARAALGDMIGLARSRGSGGWGPPW